MPEITQIPAENLNLNAPDNNVEIPPPSEGAEKLSMGDFENFSSTPSVAKKPSTAASEDTKNNKPSNTNKDEPLEEQEEVEVETKDKGEVKDGEEGNEGKENEVEEEVEENEGEEGDKKAETDVKLHGNTKRDYSGFSPEEIKLLKRLDNGRFEAISSQWKQLKAVAGKSVELVKELESAKKMLKEGGIPPTWHEHPEAYTLSKEYEKIATGYSQQEALENHYHQQIVNIKQAKPWTSVTGIDPKTGALTYSAPHEASDQAEAWVQRQMFQATTKKGQYEGQAEALKNNFRGNYEKSASTVKAEVDYIVGKMHPDLKPQEPDVAKVMEALPPIYKDHPLAYGYGQLGAIIMAQGRKLATFMNAEKKAARVAQDVTKAGPTKLPSKRPSSPAKKEGMLSMKDFEIGN